jgi:hydroxymethylpyrimidine/phosphomethylpyrimidine kinase
MAKAAQDSKEVSESSSPARPIALSIAGFDPSSGAGITADLKVFAAHQIYGMACVTALTIQSTQGVRRVEPVAPVTIRETLECLRGDVLPDGIKIGMLATAEIVGEVTAFLSFSRFDHRRVVLDPIIRSSSGRELLHPDGVDRLCTELLGLVGWITPNTDELAALIHSGPIGRDDIAQAASELRRMAAKIGNPDLHVLVTGGHLDRPDDFLLTPDGQSFWLEGERIETSSTHGTGCALSSAVLCQLIQGKDAEAAARRAKDYVISALKAAYPVGRGKGPMHHLFKV